MHLFEKCNARLDELSRILALAEGLQFETCISTKKCNVRLTLSDSFDFDSLFVFEYKLRVQHQYYRTVLAVYCTVYVRRLLEVLLECVY